MKTTIMLALLGAFIFAGCTVKQAAPKGPSYEQQQQSSDKAFKDMN